MCIRFDQRVVINVDGTFVIEGRDTNIQAKFTVPSFFGCKSWVPYHDRFEGPILDKLWRPIRDGYQDIPILLSVLVMNWRDHPNLMMARKLGLPDALWTESGQITLAMATSTSWFNDQWEGIEKAMLRIGLADILLELKTLSALETT